MTLALLNNRIVSTPDVCGGQPRINGHRITVRDVVRWFDLMGMSADEIAHEFDLQLVDIYLSMAYFHANRESLQKVWQVDDEFVSQLRKKHPSRLIPPSSK